MNKQCNMWRIEPREYKIKNRVIAIILSLVMLLIPAGAAWAFNNGDYKDYKDPGARWIYSLANNPFEKGTWNTTDYYNPRRQHCTRLKSNGAWRSAIYADAGKHAHDADINTRTIPQGTNGAVAGVDTCTVFFAPSRTNNGQQLEVNSDGEILSGESQQETTAVGPTTRQDVASAVSSGTDTPSETVK